MTEPNGQEYILESTQTRTTSIIVRKAPNIITLVQRTAVGVAVVDMSDSARNAMIELLATTAPPLVIVDGGNISFADEATSFTEDKQWSDQTGATKRRGRPPKAGAA